ncbi:hypothetical protein HMPREF0645_0295 [Hallella bergensis DSM 17361]|uniref:Uncharacterized protein n=1 Tax=Hallella bergensis DSM 17361 TaxID=585502 RepID=D1PTL0_9BACT|nr:hypothetical protein HMPREF0645_0295 [Hallella bergensis DSM 17361]
MGTGISFANILFYKITAKSLLVLILYSENLACQVTLVMMKP